MATTTTASDPGYILELGLGFWASKTLLSAVEIGLFTELGSGSKSRAELESRLDLHARSSRDFLDALVALGLLSRTGDGDGARYTNTPNTAAFLDQKSPTYVGGMLEMANQRLYPFWSHLTEALRTGIPQNEIKSTGRSFFQEIYQSRELLEGFIRAMAGLSAGAAVALAEKFDFSRYHSLVDAGGASGVLSICIAKRNPHLRATTIDLPAVEPIARETIAAAGLSDRVAAASLDFFSEPLPKADVVTMGRILHDWSLSEKLHLIRAAYDALPEGGAFIAIDTIIDDARRENAFGLLMSLNMLIETNDGFDYTGADFARWCKDAGFSQIEVLPLVGPTSAAIAIK